MKAKATRQDLKDARLDSGLTQSRASELVYRSTRAWQQWEYGDRPIDQAIFELFIFKAKLDINDYNYKLTNVT